MSRPSAPPAHGLAVSAVVSVAVWQGMIGVFAKTIHWPPIAVVGVRCAVAALALHLVVLRKPRRISARDRSHVLAVVGSGLLLGAHWATLFLGYHYANVGPVLVACFSFPMMASLAEPWLFGGRWRSSQLLCALVIVLGVAAMSLFGESDSEAEVADTRLGVGFGLLAAAAIAARNLWSRQLLRRSGSVELMAWQTTVATVAVSPWLVQATAAEPLSSEHALRMVVLGLFFTALPHTVSVWALGTLSAATAGIVGSLQVVSGVALAWLLLDEVLTLPVAVGALLVVGAVVWEARQKPNLPPVSTVLSRSKPRPEAGIE